MPPRATANRRVLDRPDSVRSGRQISQVDGWHTVKPVSTNAKSNHGLQRAASGAINPRILDPVLSYATYVGKNPADFAAAVAVDASGNAYVTGKNAGGLVFVSKFSSDGTSLLYNTVLGSGYEGVAEAIAVDASGRAYVTGAASAGFPTTADALQTTAGAGSHAFVTVLDPTGATLVYSSYLAGSIGEQGNSVAVDASGNVYVTGYTESLDFPTTAGAYQTTFGTSTRSGFVAKINPAASGAASLVYSTFLGGATTPATENAIAVDATWNAYVTGFAGQGFPTTGGAFAYTGSESGSGGVFVTKLDPAGASLVYSAYLGFGQGTGVAVDGAGDAYVTGLPQVSDFPTTAGAYQTTFPSGFVAELNAAGSALVYSTFLSGPGEDVTPQGIALQPACPSSCSAYVSGFTGATDFPSVNPVQDFNAGGDDAFVVQLSGDGSSALFSSYLGGSEDESNLSGEARMPSIAVSATGDVVVAGATASSDFPVSLSATAATQGFVAKITPTSASEVANVPASLSFGTQVVGVMSSALTVTLRNMGSKTLNITGIAAAGDYAQTDTCGTTVAGGGSCAITVTFTPTVHGARTGTITITDDAQNGPTNVINLSGTGTDAPVLDFSPAALNFGDQNVGTTSAVQTVILSNIGDQPLTLSGVSASGDFSETNNCPATLALAATCTVSVSFKPTQPGLRAGTLVASSNTAAGGNQTVLMAGTGTGVGTSALTLSTNGLAFGNEAVNTTSPSQTVTVTNTGNVPVTISSVTAVGDFTVNNNCPSSLNPALTCSVQVTFTPTAKGLRVGVLTITDSTPNSPELVSLIGTGVNPNPELSVNPAGLDFLDQAVGTTGGPQSVTVANPGNVSVAIDRVLEGGDFQVASDNCPAALAPAAQCQLGVQFTPSAAGARSGTISIVDNAPGSPQTVSLSGNGLVVVQTIVVSPSSFDFSDQVMGTVSSSQTVSITNTGNVPIAISSVTASGDFSVSPLSCGSSPTVLSPEQSCSVGVSFAPTAAGNRTGTLTIVDNVPGSPQTVSLAGNGEAGVLTVNVTPTSLDFPDTAVNSSSNAQSISITNTGNTGVALSGVTTTGDFAVTNSCGLPTILQPEQYCVVYVSFVPTTTGVRNGTLTFTDNATGSPQTVTLTGNGVAADFAIAITPPNMDFGPVMQNTTSPYQSAIIRNIGNEAVVIFNVASSGDFSLGYNGCLTTLQPAQECDVQVSFTPTAVGALTGGVTFTDNAQGSPQTMTLTGTGTSSTPAVALSPASVIFDNQSVGTTSYDYSVTLHNNGATNLTVSSVVPSGDFALAYNYCTLTLGSGGSCNFAVTFTPTTGGIRTGTVTITDSDPSSPQVQSLAGFGVAPTQGLIVSPTGLSFANQPLSTPSSQQYVTLTNTGNSSVTVSSIVASGDFSVPSNYCGTLYSNGTCQFPADFTPTATGTRTGTITITDDAPGSPQTVSLTGQGVSAVETIVVNPLGLVFPDQTVSTTGQQQYVTITNTGNSPVSIENIAVSGGFSLAFNYCIGTLQPSTSYPSFCQFSVNFIPAAVGNQTGTITITDNAQASPQTVSMSGRGIAAVQFLVINPTGLAFSDQAIGTSNAQAVVITNTGNVPVLVSSVVVSGADFTLSTNSCTNTYVPARGQYVSNSCQFAVTFNPSVSGPRTGTVTITDGAPGSPQTVTLTGNGVSSVQSLTVSPSNLAFGNQQVGVPCTIYYCEAAEQLVTLTNSGSAPITVSNVVASSSFVVLGNCGAQIAPGLTCSLAVAFAPTAAGNSTGALTISDSVPGSPQTVALAGTGISASQIISLSQSSVNFGTQTIDLTSAPLAVYYVNQGSSNVSVYGIVASGDFAQTNTCTNLMNGGTSCSILITFTPTALGGRSGTLIITDSANGSPRVITLSGTGALPAFTAAPARLSFGAQAVGVASAPQTVTVTNTGAGVMVISSLTASGDFGQANNCPANLASSASCTVSVTFTPSTGGGRTGAITITDNAPGSPQVVALSGTGASPAAGFSTNGLVFGSQNSNFNSGAQSVTLTNTGSATLSVMAVALGGNNPGDFAKTADTCSSTSLPPTNSCVVTVTFTPTAAGTRSAVITFTDNATNSPQDVTLTGTLDFTANAASNSSTSATVTAGQTATYILAFNGTPGVNGTLALSCSGAPQLATCTIAPTSLTLNGGATATATVTVTTTARGMGVPRGLRRPPTGPRGVPLLVWSLVLAELFAMAWVASKRARANTGADALANRSAVLPFGFASALLFVAFLASVAMPSCGGGGVTPPPAAGTAAGTYNLSVTATFTSGTATVTHNIPLTLTVN